MTTTTANLRPQRQMVRLNNLTKDTGRFHPRKGNLNRGHLKDLQKLLQQGHTLDPMLVWQAPDDKLYLADGYHRFAAYRSVGATKRVPCLVYSGEEDQARLLPMLDNAKTRLMLTYAERADFAWGLVLDTSLNRRAIWSSCGVSARTVTSMRTVLNQHLAAGETKDTINRTWELARAGSAAKDVEWSDEDRNAWQAKIIEQLIAQAGAILGQAARRSPEAAGEALVRILGHNLDAALQHIGYVKAVEDEFDDGDDDNDDF